MDKETGTLAERIRTLFREQGITIASILTAIGMAIGVLVEALLPGGGGAAATSGGGEPPPKDEKGLKEWVRSKLKALASLYGKLGIKAAEALPGIVRGIISWILNRAKDVVGWVSQNSFKSPLKKPDHYRNDYKDGITLHSLWGHSITN